MPRKSDQRYCSEKCQVHARRSREKGVPENVPYNSTYHRKKTALKHDSLEIEPFQRYWLDKLERMTKPWLDAIYAMPVGSDPFTKELKSLLK